MQIKKITFIFVLLLLGASGLLTGCKTVYDRMKLELSVEEIELFLPLDGEVEQPVNEPNGEDAPSEAEEMFTAKVTKVPKNILKKVTYQTTNDGIVSVSMSDEVDDETEITVTALRPGRTELIIKTIEGNKSKSVAILVLKRIQNMTRNEGYSLAVPVGVPTNINTAAAIDFYPINTNQKNVKYTLESEVAGVTVSEAGLITVSEKTVDSITVIATSLDDESLSVSIPVVIIKPIVTSDIVLTTEKAIDEWVKLGNDPANLNVDVAELLLANNMTQANMGRFIARIKSNELFRLVVTSSSNDVVEVLQVEQLEETYIYLKANNLGQATITVRAEIIGYEHYYAQKTIAVRVVNLATSVTIDGASTPRTNYAIYNNYFGLFGREVRVDLGPISAYSKTIALRMNEADVNKITIRYSDGTVLQNDLINKTVLPRGMSLFISAKELSENSDLVLREQENTVELTFVANTTIGEEVEVLNSVTFKLTQGATSLEVPASISLKKGLSASEYPNIAFTILPTSAMNDELKVESLNTSVVTVVKAGANNTYKFVAHEAGVAQVRVTTSNGISKITQVEVYVELAGAALMIEAPEQNYQVAERIINTLPDAYNSVIRATVAVGAGIQLNVLKYPSDASIVSTNFVSTNPSVAIINNNGYFLVRSIGTTTLRVTVISREYLNSQESVFVTKTYELVLTSYVPISELNLNQIQVTLYDENSLGFFDLLNSKFQLQPTLSPLNATFDIRNLNWTVSSPYLTIRDGVITASIPRDVVLPNGEMIATVTVSATEYNRYYAKTAVITIRRAVQVQSITVYNAPDGYLYFDAREGVSSAGVKQLNVQTFPYNATNPNVRYVYVKDAQDMNEAPVFRAVNGLITPLRAGIAKLHIVAEDSFISETQYARYIELVVKVADGLQENTALEIKTANDFSKIDTEQELALHYVLANNIDFTGITLTPIGLINNTIYPFTGSFSGKFSYGQLSKQYKIKGLNFNTTVTGLNNSVAMFLHNQGTIKNLELEIANLTVFANNNSAGSNANIAGLVAINEGQLQNVVVNLKQSNVRVSAQNAYVAILAATNNGTVTNSVAYGSLVVKEENPAANQVLFVGGLSGLNDENGIILGSYIPANRPIIQEEIETDYSNTLYQKEGMNSFATINTSLITSVNSASGLAVGLNYGEIMSIATDGVILGNNNIGGLVGINANLIQNSYSSSKVEGKQNVGGLIGYATEVNLPSKLITASVTGSAVEIYDRKDSSQMADIMIKGVNNVGGLIGYVDALQTFTYNYVNSYVLRTMGANYSGDVVLAYKDELTPFTMGGLIGRLVNVNTTLSKNYANVNLAVMEPQTNLNNPITYAGGLVGFVDGTVSIEHSYSRGSITLQNQNSIAGSVVGFANVNAQGSIDYAYSTIVILAETTAGLVGASASGANIAVTNTDYTIWDLNQAPLNVIWYASVEINDGLPVLRTQDNNLFINEAPQTITVTIKDSVVAINPADGSATFNHIKVTEKQALILLSNEEYSIKNIIFTTPIKGRYYLSTANTDVIEILENGNIRALKEGVATIRVSSLLNTNVFDTFEIAVSAGFTNFNLSQAQDMSTGNLSLSDILQIKKNSSLLLYSALTRAGYEVGSNVGVIYTASAGGFTVNGKVIGEAIENARTHILSTGNTASDGNIFVTATPYMAVELNGIVTYVTINELAKTFYVAIYEGATNIHTSLASAAIGLKEELTLEVYLTTDKQFEELTAQKSESIASYLDVTLSKVELVEGTTNQYVHTYMIKATPEFLEVNNKATGNFKSAKSGVITFKASTNAQVLTAFEITLTPQDLLRIDMAHYPTGETKINANGFPTYYPKELPSNIIAPAQPGILKVNLYPEYANIDYYEIVSSTTSTNQFISFEQMALVSQHASDGAINSVYYAPVVPSPAGVMFGTKLNLISTEKHENGNINYSFDGNIYVKTLISSSVKKGTVFTITITGYRVNEFGVAHVNLSKQIQLTVDALPGITLLYEGARTGYVAKGTTVPIELLVSDNYNGIIQKPTASLMTRVTEDTILITGEDALTVAQTNIIEQNGKYYLEIGPGVPSGSTIKVNAEVHRTINGVLEKSSSEITLKVVDFVLRGVQIKDSQNGAMNLYVGQTQNLRVELQTTKWNETENEIFSKYNALLTSENYNKLLEIKNQIAEKLNIVEANMSRNMKYWFERTGAQGGTYSDTMLEENSYTNYSIYKLSFEEEEYVYAGQTDIFLSAKKISSNTTLATKVEFYYDLNGGVQPVIKQNGIYVNYPQVYVENAQPTDINLPSDVQIKIVENTTKLNIVANTTEDRPVPIYNAQDLLSMQSGVDYILLNDKNNPIVLENWVPLTTAIKSLDGNERVIKIKSFAPNATSGAYNFGLFGEVNQNTVLKNIKVDIGSILIEGGMISATEFNAVNFGFIAGVNNGTISNSDVLNSYSGGATLTLNTTSTANTTFGMLAGINTGYITNSRVGLIKKGSDVYYNMNVKAKGNIAGFVGINQGVIASSYVANITLENTASSLQSSKTAGFVATNATNARISTSFVEGIQSSIATSKVIMQGGLNSIGAIGGFVHENAGIISDAYANLPIITQSRSAGFVYQNKNTGVITNAYSASKIIENTTANLPFVGSNSLEELLNENPNGLKNTYYLQNVNYFTSQFAGGYPAIAVTSFDKKSSFTGFGFLSDDEYEDYGTWTISASYPRPVLQATLDLITSERKLTGYKQDNGVFTDFYYADIESMDYKKGSKNNPILVANAKQFLEAMTLPHYLVKLDDNSNIHINRNHIRLIRDINFGEIINNNDLLNLQKIVFTGVIDGNGMSFNNVRVLSPISGAQNSFGMFYQIGLNDVDYIRAKAENTDRNRTTKAIIKNLKINVIEISATESTSVGVLAGTISNSIILNVTVSGTNITVQGRNLVGGLSGKITGDSRVINVTSNLSVSSEYRTTDYDLTGKDYSYYNEYGANEAETSYAGGIVGVLDLYSFNEDGTRRLAGDWTYETPKASLLTVRGNVMIRGEKTGGVIGYVGKDTYAKNILFELNHRVETGTQSLIGIEMLGGVIGENSGLIDHARIEHELDYQLNIIDKVSARTIVGYQNLFKESSEYVGGLVGYNNMGKIFNSYSRVDIVNQDNLQVAGGLVGIMYAGELNKVYATGHILSNQAIGGLVGYLSNSSLQDVDYTGVSTGEIALFNDAFALNNWQISAYNTVLKSTNNAYDLGEAFIDTNGDGIYTAEEPHTDLLYGAYVGKIAADVMVNAINSWFINEVFSVTGVANEAQTRVLKTIGNTNNNIVGVAQITPLEGKTQFESITNLFSTETQQKYENFANSYLWTINSIRFPQLLFSNFESIVSVETEDELITQLTVNKYATIVVTRDIYLSKNWAPTSFKGTLTGQELNGRYPIIYNLNINSTVPEGQTAIQDVGFFSTLESATISNLNFVVGGQDNVVYTGSYPNGIIGANNLENSTVAVLVGNVNNSAIKNVHIRFANSNTKLTSASQFTGIVAGRAKNVAISSVSVQNGAQFTTNIEYAGTSNIVYVGGAVGQLEVSKFLNVIIRDIELQVVPNEIAYVGGAVGRVDNVYVQNAQTNVSIITQDVNPNLVDANNYIGGIAGYSNRIELIDSIVTGKLLTGRTRNIFMGGALGYALNSRITSTYYENTLENAIESTLDTHVSKVGGLVGYTANVYVENSYAKTNITLSNKLGSTFVGGLLGHVENTLESNTISKSYANVNMNVVASNTVFAGGFIGSTGADSLSGTGGSILNAKIEEAYAMGTLRVSGSNVGAYVGGLVGLNKVKANYVFSAVKVFVNASLTQNVGGLIGYNSADIHDAYVYGTVFSNQNMLAVGSKLTVNPVIGVGLAGTTLNRVYYNQDIVGLTDRNLIDNAKTHNDLINMNVSEHNGFFIKTANSYPTLKNVAYAAQAGDLLNPILVTNATVFNGIEGSDKYFVQSNNIVVSTQINSFSGVYNGNQKQISYSQSLFTNGAETALIKQIEEYATFANVDVVSNITLTSNSSNSYYVSGITRYNYGVIYKTYSQLSVNNGNLVAVYGGQYGGMASNNMGLIEYSFVNINLNLNINIPNNAYIGGLVAFTPNSTVTPTINSSFATGSIAVTKTGAFGTTYVAGLVAHLGQGVIRNSYASSIMLVQNAKLGGLYLNKTTGTISNAKHDVFATSAYSSQDGNNSDGMLGTKNMTQMAFKETLEVSDLLNNSWTIDATINYGYPYPAYFNRSYSTNPLNSGNGTYSSPYKIHHIGRLDWVRTQLSSSMYFEQTRDIDLTNYYNENNFGMRTSFTPIGAQVSATESSFYYGTASFSPFIGIYDGKNYKINNLKQTFTETTPTLYTGLFAKLEGGLSGSNKYGYVYNLGLTNVDIKVAAQSSIGTAYLGAITGYSSYGKIINSYAIGLGNRAEPYVDANDNKRYDTGETYTDLNGDGSYTNKNITSGVADYRDKADNVGKNLYLGGLVGLMENGEINSSYSAVYIQASFGQIGGLVGTMSSLSSLKNSFADNKIDLISNFSTASTNYTLGGVVGYSENSDIYNVENISWIKIQAGQANSAALNYVGGVVGIQSGGTLTHATNSYAIFVQSAITNISFNIGGIAGAISNVNTVETLENYKDIVVQHTNYLNEPSYVGGIFGFASATSVKTMSHLKNRGVISVTTTNNNNQGNIHMGGIAAIANNYIIQYASNIGTIGAPSGVNTTKTAHSRIRVGGIVGQTNQLVEYSHNLGTIGLNRENDGISSNSTVEVQVGGIAGVGTVIKRSYNSGAINVSNNDPGNTLYFYIGGIMAQNLNITLERVYNTGNINVTLGNQNQRYITIGGIVGDMTGVILDVYNTGNINVNYHTNANTNMGGIMGQFTGTIDSERAGIFQVYNSGTLNQSVGINYRNTGQIVGYILDYSLTYGYITISNHHYYNQQIIDSLPGPGASIPVYMGSYGYTFNSSGSTWESAGHSGKNDSLSNGHTLAAMRKQGTYTGWNFTSIWTIQEDVTMPTLRILTSFELTWGSVAEPTISLTSLQLTPRTVPSVNLGAPSSGGGSTGGSGGGASGGSIPKPPIEQLEEN